MKPLVTFIVLISVLTAAGVAFGREPSVQEVQIRVLEYAGLNNRLYSKWHKNIRWAAALPRLQLGFDRDVGDVVRLSTSDNVSISGGDVTVGPDESSFDQNLDSGMEFKVTAVWNLGELVFNQDSIDVQSELRRENRDRQDLLFNVNRIYFERQKLLKRGRTEKLKVEELTAHLDALTGGWFSNEVNHE